MFSKEKTAYQPATSIWNCPVLEVDFLICTTSCKSNAYGAKELRFSNFGANSWKIEKLKYNFIRINILYQNQITFLKLPHKLPAEEDLFMSGQCLPKQ